MPTLPVEPTKAAAPAAPAIVTSKSETPIKIKMRELEARLVSEQNAAHGRDTLKVKATVAMLEDLRHLESKLMSGGDPRLPRGLMLDGPLKVAQEKNPDLVVRWINEAMPGRSDVVKMYGYEKLDAEKEGKQLGGLALYGIPRERWGMLEAAKRERTSGQLKRFNEDMREQIHEVIKEVRDNYGIELQEKEVFINQYQEG